MKKSIARVSALLLSLLLALAYMAPAAAAQGDTAPKPALAPMREVAVHGEVLTPPSDTLHRPDSKGETRTYAPAFILPDTALTPVKNQNPYGTCWAFAAMASAESSAKSTGLAADPDYSEWQLAWYTYTSQDGLPAFDLTDGDTPYSHGGSDPQAVAMFARGSSPVPESQAPYGGATPSASIARSCDLKRWSVAHTSSEWKAFLEDKGALSIYFFWDDTGKYYSDTYGSYYQDEATGSSNHAVTLVGWDDTFPASKFKIAPPGPGAWIVKNSWGDGWGNDGYFYLSYYCKDLGAEASAYEMMATPAGEKEYTYDDLGQVGYLGYYSDTAYMKGVYTAQGNETLTSVATFAEGDGTSYSIDITTQNGDGDFVKAWSSPQTGTIAAAGYSRIDLSRPVYLAEGQQYEVIIRLTVPGADFPMPVEMKYDEYSTNANIESGKTYLSYDGLSWDDAYGIKCEMCIYAFTAPRTITALANGEGVADKSFVRDSVTATADESDLFTKVATLNGSVIAWPSSGAFTADGMYLLMAIDNAGNPSALTFTIDRTAPAILRYNPSNTGVPSGTYVRTEVSALVSDANLLSKTVTKNGALCSWPASNIFTADGRYIVTAKDKAGNQTAISFIIDRTPPKITVKSSRGTIVANNGSVRSKAIVTASDTNLYSKSIRRNGVTVYWPSSGAFTSRGKYVVTVKDRAGNISTYTFTIT